MLAHYGPKVAQEPQLPTLLTRAGGQDDGSLDKLPQIMYLLSQIAYGIYPNERNMDCCWIAVDYYLHFSAECIGLPEASLSSMPNAEKLAKKQIYFDKLVDLCVNTPKANTYGNKCELNLSVTTVNLFIVLSDIGNGPICCGTARGRFIPVCCGVFYVKSVKVDGVGSCALDRCAKYCNGLSILYIYMFNI